MHLQHALVLSASQCITLFVFGLSLSLSLSSTLCVVRRCYGYVHASVFIQHQPTCIHIGCSVALFMQVVAHSLGAWLAYEFLCHARHEGLPMPSQVFLSAMPYPSIPQCHRPWRPQHKLQEKEFQVAVLLHASHEKPVSVLLCPVRQLAHAVKQIHRSRLGTPILCCKQHTLQ